MKLRLLWKMILAFFILTVYSCHTATTDRKDYKEVMRVHDEAMARMGEIYELKGQIEELRLEIQDTNKIVLSQTLVASLEKADEGMMDWMAKFRIPENAEDTQLKAYFAEEQKKVDIVNRDINNAIADAKQFVKDYK